MSSDQKVSRRSLLKTTAVGLGAIGFPTVIPASAVGRDGKVAPSNRITLGIIGTGNQGLNDIRSFLQDERVQIVAVCDVNRESPGYWNGGVAGREPARRLIEAAYAKQREAGSYRGCDALTDFQDLIGREDLDAVEVCTPDHWHAIPVLMAAKAKKDIYCQKPLSLTIAEGRAMAKAVKKHRVVFQTGSQQRSDARFRTACQAVRSGRIGELKTIEARIGGGPVSDWEEPSEPPPGLDWNLWLGPARWVPYQKNRCHYQFRWIYDYSGGKMTDWGAHHNDIAQWGNGSDDSGPVTIDGWAEFPTKGIWDTATRFEVTSTYPNGVVLKTMSEGENGVQFTGTRGWVFVSRGTIRASDPAVIQDPFSSAEAPLYLSDEHHRNWLDCIKTRERPICDVEVGHRSATVCHLENIAIRSGRKLTWDPKTEKFVNDSEADRWLSRPMRAPWHL